jgi:pyruvate ferredoxin oxidoreductase alpha subunit
VRQQREGSQAVAEAVGLCRPAVVSAYPISPQTHIVEHLSRLVLSGALPGCAYLNVESEFASMSTLIGASAAGARCYTATASQGLLFMAEAVFNAAGLGLPMVMTVANRAIGAPINIWNDQGDSMAMRDCGWVQLYAADNQEAVDLHVMAFRLADELELPVMVCMDGFVLTHAFEEVELPTQEQVDAVLPPSPPRPVLDPAAPVTIGAMVGPEAYTEVRYLADRRHRDALRLLPVIAADYRRVTGRDAGGLVRTYSCEGADTVVVALGSVLGTLADVVDERGDSERVGVLGLTCYRPFPVDAVRAAVSSARRVVVIERALALGEDGPVAADVARAVAGPGRSVSTVVCGLGGRPVTSAVLHRLLDRVARDDLPHRLFLDLDREVVDRELHRTAALALQAAEVRS